MSKFLLDDDADEADDDDRAMTIPRRYLRAKMNMVIKTLLNSEGT